MVNFSFVDDTHNFIIIYSFIYDNILNSNSKTFLLNSGHAHSIVY